MSNGIVLKQASALADIETPDSTHVTLSAYNDELVSKDDTDTYYHEQWRSYDQQTTDNSATVPTGAYVSVAEGQSVLVELKGLGRIANLSAVIGGSVWGVFRRASGGNVTLVGSLQGTPQEDSGGTPVLTLVADTVNQRVNAQVTGITAETWNWRVRIRGMIY